jgi:hypothetical protein
VFFHPQKGTAALTLAIDCDPNLKTSPPGETVFNQDKSLVPGRSSKVDHEKSFLVNPAFDPLDWPAKSQLPRKRTWVRNYGWLTQNMPCSQRKLLMFYKFAEIIVKY